jgi:hypothetical protein
MSDAKPQSNYARKHSYLSRNGLWGFEVAEPKPWKKARAGGEGAVVQTNRPCRYGAEIATRNVEIVRMQVEQEARRPPRFALP